MEPMKWKNPGRKRRTDISYTDSDYTKYYDVDIKDFEALVTKIQSGIHLNEVENNRYGDYILTMCNIVQEGPKFKNKPYKDKCDMLELMYFDMLNGMKYFNPSKGKIYSYSYRIGYIAGIHYYTNAVKNKKKKDAIMKHCMDELSEYLDGISTHKVNTNHHYIDNG